MREIKNDRTAPHDTYTSYLNEWYAGFQRGNNFLSLQIIMIAEVLCVVSSVCPALNQQASSSFLIRTVKLFFYSVYVDAINERWNSNATFHRFHDVARRVIQAVEVKKKINTGTIDLYGSWRCAHAPEVLRHAHIEKWWVPAFHISAGHVHALRDRYKNYSD